MSSAGGGGGGGAEGQVPKEPQASPPDSMDAIIAQATNELKKARDQARFAENAKDRAEKSAADANESQQATAIAFEGAKAHVADAEAQLRIATVAASSAGTEAQSATVAKESAQRESVESATARTEAQTRSAEANQAATDSRTAATAASQSQVNAEGAATNAATFRDIAQAKSEEAQTFTTDIAGLLKSAKSDQDATAALARKAAAVEAKLKEYEGSIAAHEKRITELDKQIVGLLPGATSVGLASAFASQKTTYRWTKIGWAFIFVSSILGIIFAVVNFQDKTPDTLEGWLIHVAMRSPIISALVWLGVVAKRYYGVAERQQQDYTFKETTSATFEGYKQQMSQVKTASGPLETLCENTLRIIGQHPARFYSNDREDGSPGRLARVLKQKSEETSSAGNEDRPTP